MDADRLRVSRERRRQHIVKALERVAHVIAMSRDLARLPGHRERNLRRIAEGEQEIVELEGQLGALSAEGEREPTPGAGGHIR